MLLAEGDPVVARGVQSAMEQRGFWVDAVTDGFLALNRMQLGVADVCVLDERLGAMDGLTVLRKARQSGVHIPILVLLGSSTAAQRMVWYQTGADDIVARPFDPDELSAQVRVLHRRGGLSGAGSEQMVCGPLLFDLLSGSFYWNGQLLPFTPNEQAFLKALMARPGYPVPKDRLFRSIFRGDVKTSAMDVLACRVRRKLLGLGLSVATVRGVGYMLEPTTDLDTKVRFPEAA